MTSIQEYLKVFSSHTDYEEYASGGTMVRPNVSYCEDVKDVHYNPYVETRLTTYYDITDISQPTTIFTNYDNSVKSIEIDGVMLDSVVTTYQFNTVGEHIIKYEFNDPTKVGNNAPLFWGLTIIKRAIISNTFTSIGDNAFNGCSGLTNIEIPNSVTNIGKYAFQGCSSVTNINIPNGITSIGNYTFQTCRSLTSITIPSSVTEIGYYAFQMCISLTSIELPSGVTSIDNCAFNACGDLTSIELPSGVTSIGDNVFNACNSLSNVTVLATTPPTLGSSVFDNNASGRKIYVPSASVNAYKAATNWSTYANQIQAIPTT